MHLTAQEALKKFVDARRLLKEIYGAIYKEIPGPDQSTFLNAMRYLEIIEKDLKAKAWEEHSFAKAMDQATFNTLTAGGEDATPACQRPIDPPMNVKSIGRRTRTKQS